MSHINLGSNTLYYCQHCPLGGQFLDNDLVIGHMKNDHEDLKQCNRCGDYFSKENIQQHIYDQHHNTMFFCPISNCRSAHSAKIALNYHMQTEHEASQQLNSVEGYSIFSLPLVQYLHSCRLLVYRSTTKTIDCLYLSMVQSQRQQLSKDIGAH